MATRHYTEEAYKQIKRTIEQIDNADVNPVMVFFGDLFQRIGQYLQIYKVDDYQNNIQKWYDKVLDSHNTTLSKVNSIFNEVESVDFEYRDIMDGTLSGIVDFQSTLNTLRDVISGKTTLSEGQATAKKYLNSGKNALNGAYDTLLTKMEKRGLVDSTKELIGDVLKLGAGFVSLLVPDEPVKYGVKCKKFADTFTALLGDLGATTTGVLVWVTFDVIGLDRKDYLDFRYNQLAEAKDFKDTNSISDWLGGMAEDMNENLADCPEDSLLYPVVKASAKLSEFTADTADAVDIAADAYDIVSDVKDIHDNLDEWMNGKNYSLEEYTKLFDEELPWKSEYIMDGDNPMINVRTSPGEIISKLFSDRTGIPLSGWDDPSKRAGNIWKTAGTIWSYGEKLIPDSDGYTKVHEIPDVAISKIKDTKFLKDVFDFARDLDEFAHSNPFSSTANSGTIDTTGLGRISVPDVAGALPTGPRGGVGEMGGR